MVKSNRFPIVIVLLSTFLDFLGYGIIISFLPFYAQKFEVGGFVIGLFFTSYAIAQFIFTPLWGRISDHIGRRPVIILSLFGTAGYLFIFMFTPSLWWLLGARIIGGIFGSSMAAGQAYISDVMPDEKKTAGMGYFGAAYGAGFIAGPALGSFFVNTGISLPGCLLISGRALCVTDYISDSRLVMPFIIASLLAFIGGVIAYIFLPESLPLRKSYLRETRGDMISPRLNQNNYSWFLNGFSYIFRQKTILFLILLYFLGIFSFVNLETVFSIFSNLKFNLTSKDIGYFFSYIALLTIVIQIIVVPYFSRRLNDFIILLAGGFCFGVGLLILPLVATMIGFIGALTITALGIGLSYPSILGMISKLSGKENYGATMGITQGMAHLAQIFGSLWAGFAFQYIFPSAPFLTGGIIMLTVFIVTLRIYWKNGLNYA